MNLMELIKLFSRYFNDKQYIVDDIISKNKSKIVFILESPHNEEIDAGHPTAGQSGIDMADFINIGDKKKSLGEIANNDNSLGISILNISRVPLQVTNDLDEEYKDLVYELDRIIRKGYDSFGKHISKKEFNEIEETLLCDFRKRYNNVVLNEDTLIVICGEFAKVYFDKIKKDDKVIYVPHPSRGQWKVNYNGLLRLSEFEINKK